MTETLGEKTPSSSISSEEKTSSSSLSAETRAINTRLCTTLITATRGEVDTLKNSQLCY